MPEGTLAACRLLYPAPMRGKRCVARAHGFDLYAERAGRARLPYSCLTLAACDAVRRLYACEPVDVFANVSSSEGLPVSIMEAISFGVPVLGPAVGGVPEFVTPATGGTLPADASPRSFADALERVARMPWDREAIQREQRRRFSIENYHALAEFLGGGRLGHDATRDEPDPGLPRRPGVL